MKRNLNQELEQVDLNLLKHHPRNANKGNVEEIKKSLAVNGWYGSVVVNRKTKHILAGNHRVMAAKALGWETVPVQWVDVTPEEELRILIVDNRTTRIGEDDTTAITDILAELSQTPIGLDGTGYSAADLDALIDSLTDGQPTELLTDPDEVPEVPDEAITKPGDLWILGNHRLLCGDSTKAEDVERLMDGATARYGMFDPPYGIAVIGGVGKAKGSIGGVSKAKGSIGGVSKAKANQYEPIHGDDQPFDPSPFFELAEECVWWGANYFADKMPCKKGWIVWDKKGREWNDNFSDCEMAWTPFKTVARIYRHVWMGLVQEGERELRQHPTQKPVALFVKLMRELFTEDGVILDLWLGSGTTLIAAEQLGRKCYGMEISPHYCDVIVKRWENATGKKAVLDEG